MNLREFIRHLETLARKGAELHDVENSEGILIYEDDIEVNAEAGTVTISE